MGMQKMAKKKGKVPVEEEVMVDEVRAEKGRKRQKMTKKKTTEDEVPVEEEVRADKGAKSRSKQVKFVVAEKPANEELSEDDDDEADDEADGEDGDDEGDEESEGDDEGQDDDDDDDEGDDEAEGEGDVVENEVRQASAKKHRTVKDDAANKKLHVGETSRKRKAREERKQIRDANTKKKVVEGHGSPKLLFGLLSKLSEAQKKDVEDIGFGGLLELKARAFCHYMIDWLLDRYDHVAQMFFINRFTHCVVTKHDVYDVFMLPCTETPVRLKSTKKKDNPDTELVMAWKNMFNVDADHDILFEKVEEAMLTFVAGGPEFKKMFVLYAMGTFLAPTVHSRIDLRLVTAVENVEQIVQQDWCSYVLFRLNEAIKSQKTHESKHMGGCLMFLQLVYFHRLVWRGIPCKSDLPLIQHWTYDAVRSRMLEEMEGYRLNGQHFGIGINDLTTYPVSKNKAKVLYRRGLNEASCSREATDRFLMLPIPTDVCTDKELREKYKDVRIQKWMTTKRNLELVLRVHYDMGRDLVVAGEGAVESRSAAAMSTGGDDIGQASQFSWTQALEDPDFLDEFNALGKKVDDFIATQVIEPPSFDLGIEFAHRPREQPREQPEQPTNEQTAPEQPRSEETTSNHEQTAPDQPTKELGVPKKRGGKLTVPEQPTRLTRNAAKKGGAGAEV